MSLSVRCPEDPVRIPHAAEFQLPDRGITGLFGASGCGKTRLLRLIAGLDRHTTAQVSFAGDTWQSERKFAPTHLRGAAMVFQQASLFEHLSVEGNLRFAERRARSPHPQREQLLDAMGVRPLLHRAVQTLSGGQSQRVAILRALLAQPRLLLLDEPLSNLDDAAREEILGLLEQLHAQLPIPVIYVSHQFDEITRLADYLLLMADGRINAAGKLQALCTDPELPLIRRNDAAAVLNASAGTFDADAHLLQVSSDAGPLLVPAERAPASEPLRVRIQARDVSLALSPPQHSSVLNALPATVESVHETGAGQVTIRLRSQQALLLARISEHSRQQLQVMPGQSLFALVKGAALLRSR